MKRLIRLYPARWRRQYGEELGQVLDDLRPMSPRTRLRVAADLLRGAFDAHLTLSRGKAIGFALRRAMIVAAIVWAALSVEIVLSNVVFPTAEDNDGLSVLISYLAVFGALAILGVLTSRVTRNWQVFALAGGVAGALIGSLTIGTYAVIDNVFLDIISRQQAKIDGLAGSGFTSMRTYVNLSLLTGGVALSVFFGIAGACLAVLGGQATSSRRTSPYRPPPDVKVHLLHDFAPQRHGRHQRLRAAGLLGRRSLPPSRRPDHRRRPRHHAATRNRFAMHRR